jgi:hypothetical protein
MQRSPVTFCEPDKDGIVPFLGSFAEQEAGENRSEDQRENQLCSCQRQRGRFLTILTLEVNPL